MASSKVYVDDGVLVPDTIMELFRVQPRVYINPPIEQRPGPAPRHIVNDRIWVDEKMRDFLKALEPQLPKPVLLHFRGYGRETGTAIINLESIYWTNHVEEYCRLDFKHPEEMHRLHGCPNFWGAFILAMMPVSEFKDVCVEDLDGREFVRLCDEAIKAQAGGAMDAFQRIDWSKVPPEHPICETLVEVPTVRIQARGLNYPHRPSEFEGQEEIVVQWYGDNNRGELKDRNLQFAFPLMSKPDAIQWFGHPEWYRTVMLGPLKNWPNKDGLAMLIQGGRKPDSVVIYVITSQIGLDDGKGGTRPSALMTEVICLGDPTFGVIHPREYTNWAVSDEEIAKLVQTRNRR
jgi:hypothetical protein